MTFRHGTAVLVLVALARCSAPVTPPTDSGGVGVSRAELFANGGFEGDAIGASPSSWTVEKYLNNRVTTLALGAPTNNLGLLAVPPASIANLNLTPGAGGLNTFVVGAATVESVADPNLGNGQSFRYPKFGTRSVVVNPGAQNRTPTDANPTGRNRSVNSMKQTMTLAAGDVDPVDGNIHIRFVAAPVLEDPGHTSFEQPYFFIQVRNVTRNTVLYSNFNFAGQAGVPWQIAGGIKFTDWQLIDVAPGNGAVIGEQVELIVFAAGCSRGGHWGRVYVDAFGSTVPGLYLTGTAPASSPNNTNLTYTLSYRNGSAVATNGTQVVFNAPPNTTLVSTTQPGCAIAANTLTCPIGALAAGAGGSFNVVVTISAAFTGLLTAQNYRISATGVSPLIGSKIDTIVYNGPAVLSVVSGTPQSAVVNTQHGADLVVQVVDRNGLPISGMQVTFTPPGSGASATGLPLAITGANGRASSRPTANTVAGAFTVTASVPGIASTGTFNLTNTAGVPASVSVVSGAPQSATVNTAFGSSLVVVVVDAFGNPVPGATVTFAAPGSGASATLTPAAVTNAAGQTQVTPTANSTAGVYNVTASVAGVMTSVTFALTNTAGAAASLAVVSGTPQSATVRTAFGAPLVVVVRDAFSNPVAGRTVTFSPPGTGASAVLSAGAVTNALGQTQVTATANTTAGPYAVAASTAGVATSANFLLTNTAGPAAVIAVVSGSPQSALPGSVFGAPLVVRVTDADGNPVPNAAVTVTPPSSGASAVISGTLTTGVNGEVSVTATANQTSGGPYQVAASVSGVSAPVNFSLTNSVVTPVITSPAQNATLTDSTPDISGTAGANEAVSVFADGGTTPVCTTTANAMGAWTCTVSPSLADGPHVFVARTVNGAMTASSAPRTVVIDANPPPVPVITVPAEGSTTSPSPTVSGVAEPGSTVRVFVDGSAMPACTAVTNAAGNYTCVIVGPLVAGAHTLTATATDAAGNSSTATPARNFTVAASTPPGPPVIAAPAPGSSTNDITPAVSGTATPGSEVRVYVDGSTTPACTATASTSGTFSCDVSPALAAGAHSVVATASTSAGTSAPSSTTPFTIDTMAPAVPVITAPAMNATTSTTPVYVGTSEPNAIVKVFIDGSMTPVCVATANATGAWSCASSAPLTVGQHAVTASATDAAGNTSPLTATTSFTVAMGQTPAAPVLSTPIANTITGDVTPTFDGTATPGSTVSVFVDGSPMPVCTAVADVMGRFVCAPTTPLAEGPHTVTASSATVDGNSPLSAAVPFTVDTTSPALPAITSPTMAQVTNSTPTITGTAEAGSTVTVRVDGQVVCEVAATAQGTWSCPVTQPLAPGAHTTTARATDKAGNVSMTTSPRSFTVAGTPMTPVLQQPAVGSTTSNRTPTMTGLADPGSVVTVKVDGMTVCTTTADAMGRFSCSTTTPLSEGSHSATVTAVTPGGTATSVPTVFTVTAGTPMAPVITSPSSSGTTNTKTPEFVGTAEPGSSVSVKVDGMTVCTATTTASGQFSCRSTTPLAPGPHSVTATATNSNGDSPGSTSVTFTVPTPPELVAPSEGSTTGSRPSFTGTGQPGNTVSVVVDGAVVCSAVAADDGRWSCTPDAPLSIGRHEVVVKDGQLESGISSLIVVERSLSGGGIGTGCSSTGAAQLWWLLGLMAVVWGRRRASRAVVRLRPSVLTVAATVSMFAGSAAAQSVTPVPSFELERVRLNAAAAHGLLVESADLLPKYGYRAAVTFHFQRDPLVLVENGKRVGSVVSSRIGLHLSAAFTITDWLDVSVQFPIVLSQSGSDLSSRGYAPVFAGVAAATPWIAARVAPWQERRGDALDVSFGVALGLPVGSEAAFTKDSTVSAIPSVAAGKKLGSFFRLGGSVGVLFRGARTLSPSATTVNDEVGSLLMPALILSTLGDGLRGEVSTRVDVPFTRSGLGTEVNLGLRYPLFKMLEVYAVGGTGYGTFPGTPTFRVLAGLALAPVPEVRQTPRCVEGQSYELAACPDLDLDGDGVMNGRDTCPSVAGLASRAGCPDVDTDADGIFDSVDACPTVSGVKPYRGCPVPDADKDGIVDDADTCPTIAGLKQYGGCPVPDADRDGVLDQVDACPTVPGVLSQKGCPEVDTDADGVMDPVDACRTVPGVKENDGCPAAKKLLVVISKDRIIIREKVNFATGKSNILPKSFPLLDQVFQVLKDHPEVERVSIEGHTDGNGARSMNVKLSEARAESVRQWLLKKGIDPGRVTSKGFGPDRPIDSNDTEAGREQNRRVEFLIVGNETDKK
jgi:outer membrane protein OmpA-like peptidoglycan-associated protein